MRDILKKLADRDIPTTFTFVLLPQFSLMAFASTLEPLREANWVSGRTLYKWEIASVDARPVVASNGLCIEATKSYDNLESAEIVVICSSFDPQKYSQPGLLKSLRLSARRGAAMGAIDTGTFILAQAGLLDGHDATIHWENAPSMAAFPKVRLAETIYQIDRNRFTAAGGTSGLDMIMHFVQLQHGRALAAKIADEFIYSRMRESYDRQRMETGRKFPTSNPKLLQMLQHMDAVMGRPVSVKELASLVGVTSREVQRLFQKNLSTTPSDYHKSTRLGRARSMLRQSHASILDIALECGFNSAADFSRSYRAYFGLSPSADRGTSELSRERLKS